MKPDFWRNPKKAIKRAYKCTDDYILHNVVGPRGGSTAVTAIVIDGKTTVIANVGDSRAILCRASDVVKQITVDHEPDKERDLVESKGGFVSQKPGPFFVSLLRRKGKKIHFELPTQNQSSMLLIMIR